VTITQAFYLGRTEVTQGQWQAVMGTAMPTSCGSYGMGSDYPVYCVSWDDICGGATGSSCTATSFIGKLNAQQGSTKFRLPSEAEWEYAARATTTTEFSFAVSPTWDIACGAFPEALSYMWWCGNAGLTNHPVATKAANPWGLFDMHGSLWEWVGDWYGRYSSSSQTDPQGPASGSNRVLRGGLWNGGAHACRSAHRWDIFPSFRSNGTGFRLARSQ
jgi:formylglycine-generating enzyme required for sulfatase activity